MKTPFLYKIWRYQKTDKIKKSVQSTLTILCILLLVRCDNYVAVDLPPSQLTSTAVFEDKTTANAAMTSIYAKIRDSGILSGSAAGISNELGNYTDELVFYGNISNPSQNFYNNTILASNTAITSWWGNSYNAIYAANAVIEGVTKSTSLKTADKNQLTGEALFVRGLIHFYLLNLYGDIPYITTTDYRQNSAVGRLATSVVYAHIIDDLSQSITLLPEDYINAERVRPNKAVAQALLARVYLYTGAWAEAANTASAVLNNTVLYVWENNLDNIFLKDSSTTLWQLMSAADGQNTMDGETFIFTSGPPKLVALSNEVVAAFEPGDERRNHWVAAVTKGTSTWYHANKYKEKSMTASSVEYSILFRLAEQYLIRAEARAQQDDLIGAKEDLNKIRNTAGLADTSASSQEQILDAIQRERRVEFFTELGHRFFDLKRTNQLDAVLTPIKTGWDSTDRLLPVPELELLINTNLTPQNAGY